MIPFMCQLCSLFAANCGADRDSAGQGVLYAQSRITSHLLCALFYVNQCVPAFLCRLLTVASFSTAMHHICGYKKQLG